MPENKNSFLPKMQPSIASSLMTVILMSHGQEHLPCDPPSLNETEQLIHSLLTTLLIVEYSSTHFFSEMKKKIFRQ